MAHAARKAGEKVARVLIVDDHPAVREGLSIRLSRQPDLEVCGEAADVPAALRLAADTDPDVVVVDISLRSGDGIELIKRLRARDSRAKMLVWSMYGESLYAERALQAGAAGYITKGEATDTIVAAIRRVLAGGLYLSPGMTESVVRRAVAAPGQGPLPDPIAALSDRELEVFRHLGRGLDTNRIAERMRVSPKTVETYRARVKEKLGLDTATAVLQRAVRWVLENG